MSATKVVIIVLVVIVVSFVVLVVWGAGNNSNPRYRDDADAKTNAEKFDPGSAPLAGGINDLFGSHIPKFDPAYLRPQLTTFDLQKQANYSVAVLADDSHPQRQLKVKVQPAKSPSSSCALVTFTAGENAPDKKSDPQKSDYSRIKDHNEVTFIISKGGGRLDIGRSSPSSSVPCTVTLQ